MMEVAGVNVRTFQRALSELGIVGKGANRFGITYELPGSSNQRDGRRTAAEDSEPTIFEDFINDNAFIFQNQKSNDTVMSSSFLISTSMCLSVHIRETITRNFINDSIDDTLSLYTYLVVCR